MNCYCAFLLRLRAFWANVWLYFFAMSHFINNCAFEYTFVSMHEMQRIVKLHLFNCLLTKKIRSDNSGNWIKKKIKKWRNKNCDMSAFVGKKILSSLLLLDATVQWWPSTAWYQHIFLPQLLGKFNFYFHITQFIMDTSLQHFPQTMPNQTRNVTQITPVVDVCVSVLGKWAIWFRDVFIAGVCSFAHKISILSFAVFARAQAVG